MKVLHLSAASEHTGAGRAVLLTHEALLRLDIESRILFLKSTLNSNEIYSYHKHSWPTGIIRLITTYLDRIPLKFYPKKTSSIFSPGVTGLNLIRNRHIVWADIIHIHWANHGFINISDIKQWNKPIVWTLRDMWAFTGGCHQSFGCESFKMACGNCPALGSSCERDLSRYVLQKKLKSLQNVDIVWIAISSWMQKQATESSILKGKHVEVVFSGTDANTFNILGKLEARAKLNLPLQRSIILLGAADIREEYKGFDHAKRVLQRMDKDILVITFGRECFHDSEIPQQTVHFGEVNSNMSLCEIYNVADLFFGPSIAEALGKTFIEAQLCGLPVLCFDETGPADIVKHKETGYLAKFRDDEDLLIGMEYCLNSKLNRHVIRERAVELFDIMKVAKKYIGLYEKIIVGRSYCGAT